METKPIAILGSNSKDDKRFLILALFIDNIAVQNKLYSLTKKWKGRSNQEDNSRLDKDILGSIAKLKIPKEILGLKEACHLVLKDAITLGSLWQEYKLTPLETLFSLRGHIPKKLPQELQRDRDWYWRNKKGEKISKIAETFDTRFDISNRRDTVKKAIRQYKHLISRER